MAIDNDNVTVDGSIDAGWTSYYGDGETVGVSDGDDEGEINHETLPADVDPADLTDTQRRIIERAAVGSWESQTALADAVGVSRQSVSRTLLNHAPDLNKRVKMSETEAGMRGNPTYRDDRTDGATDEAVRAAVGEAADDGMDRARVEGALELCERFQLVLGDGVGQRALAQVQTELELAVGEMVADE